MTRLATEINLHDGLVNRIIIDQKEETIIFELICGDLQLGYSDVHLKYSSVDFDSLDFQNVAYIVRYRKTELLYHEIDLDEDKYYIHSFLFYPDGEFSIRFKQMELNQTSKPDRKRMHLGDPFQFCFGTLPDGSL